MVAKILFSASLMFSLAAHANLTPGGGGGNLPPSGGIALLTGRPGGQNMAGGINAGENLSLQSTTDGSKGVIIAEDGSSLVMATDTAYGAAGGPSYEGGVLLQLADEGNNGAIAVLTSLKGSGGNTSSSIYLAGGNGTFPSPSYLTDGQAAGGVNFTGADNSNPDAYVLGSINVTAALNQSDTNQGANMNLNVGKSNDVGTGYNLQLNGSNRQLISDMGLVMHGPNDPGGVAAHDVAFSSKDVTETGVATLSFRTAEDVGGSAPPAANRSLRVWVNGAEYFLHLTAN